MWRVQLEKSVQSPPFELIDIVVRAGAGAGKTTELTQRVLKLAEDGFAKNGKYPHFVVTTFTRKATQELKERLLKEAMKRENPGLINFVKRSSQLHISTIHGILSVYLSRFGSIMGLSPKMTVVSDSREKFLFKKKIRELCESSAEFNADFQALMETVEFNDLLEALRQVFRLKMQFEGAAPWSTADFQKILEEKSDTWVQVADRLAREIRATEVPEAWQELAHYCERFLPTLKKQFDQPTWEKFLADLPAPRKSKTVTDAIVEYRDQLKEVKDLFSQWALTPEFFASHDLHCARFQKCADQMSEVIRQTKLFSGEITMQDLETLSLFLIRRHPETATAFSKQWDYWLVDEYQDTSPAQVELIRALSQASKSFVVGDPQQSIYLFRGARAEVFSAREQEVAASGGVLFSKLTNYRSEPELLEFFNFLFTGLSPQFQKMIPRSAVEAGNEKRVAEIMEVQEAEDQEIDGEFEAVLARFQELIREKVPLEKICFLSRNNRDLEEIAWLAHQKGIPVQLHSAGQFFERREIVDALTLLKFLANPHDNKNLLQLLRSPVFRIPDQTLYEWCQSAGPSFWQSFQKHKNEILQKLQERLILAQTQGIGQVWRQLLVKEGYFKFAHALDPSGRREANLWKLLQMVRGEERRPGFSYLEFLKSMDLRSLSTEEPDEADAVPVIEPQKIHLMTVHASKGLQFGHVILARMGRTSPTPSTEFFMHDENTGHWTLSLVEPEEGKKSASLAGRNLLVTMKRRQEEEEDRVLYVALTRAQETVTLIWNAKSEKNSWAQRLPFNTDEGLHQTKLFSYRVRKGRFEPEQISLAGASQIQEIKVFQSPEDHELQALSVSDILDKKNVGLKAELSDIQKAVTGVDVHRLFENLKYKWMRESSYDWREMLPSLIPHHQKALQYLAQDQQGRWLDVIRKGEAEFGMAVQFDGKLIQGQIDLWGEDSQGQMWVVDYKTGSPNYKEKAFYQLQIYCWALKKIKKIEAHRTVNLAVIYPFSEMTVVREASSILEIEKELRAVKE